MTSVERIYLKFRITVIVHVTYLQPYKGPCKAYALVSWVPILAYRNPITFLKAALMNPIWVTVVLNIQQLGRSEGLGVGARNKVLGSAESIFINSSFHFPFHYPHISPIYYSSFHCLFHYPNILIYPCSHSMGSQYLLVVS